MLRAALARSLPDYMVPARFVFLSQIPVNTSGKVDRKALDALTLDEGEADAEKEEPRTWTEQRLAAIWSALLGRASIGRHDNFFHAGGLSLLAVQLAAKFKETFGVVLPLSQIFASPTLAAFAQAVDMHDTNDANDANDTQPLRAGLVVPMQGRGVNREQGVPTFLIHPSGGTVFCYDQLARQLGDGGPVYAIQSPEIAGLELDYDFDSLCRRYACEIGALCPEGKVRIAGWSLGGALALRIAEMLEQEQRVVESVSLFDTHVAIQERARTWEEFLAWAFLFLEPAALALDRDFAATHGNVRAIAEACGMESFLALLRDDPQWLLVQGIDARYLDFLREQYRIQQVHVALLREFSPGMVNAPLHVAWAQDSIAGGVMPADWLSLTRAPARSTQCILPGHHDNLLLNEANLAVIARNMLGRTGVEACTATTFNAPSR